LRGFEATAVAVMDILTLADGVDQSLITMGLLRLQRFRDELYRCLGQRRDALFELIDGLLAAEAISSLPHLSLVPTHRRGWGSVHAALAAGEVDAARLAELLITHRGDGRAPVFAVDASTWGGSAQDFDHVHIHAAGCRSPQYGRLHIAVTPPERGPAGEGARR
jgi:DDE superfamily endonuclease